MSLKHSYTLIAPFYEALIAGGTQRIRRDSWLKAGDVSNCKVLIPGIGTGLDIPFLPNGGHYTGFDLTPAMLARAERRTAQSKSNCNLVLKLGDIHALDEADEQFDLIVMHLILAVVPSPEQALNEMLRVLKPGGRIIILDKFLKPGERAFLRRLISLLMRHIATRTDVVFEEVLSKTEGLQVVSDEPVLMNGWFRRIELQRV